MANTSFGLPESPLPEAPRYPLTVANFNLLNLAKAGQKRYDNDRPLSEEQFRKKAEWIAAQVDRLRADVIGFQEVWSEEALQACLSKTSLGQKGWKTVVAPGADGKNAVPKVGIACRGEAVVESIAAFPGGLQVEVPDLSALTGPMRAFERPILHAKFALQNEVNAHVLVTHMKSKRARFLERRDGATEEDDHDPRLQARAALRSLIMRGAEAAALRLIVLDLRTRHPQEPVILLGDLNDGPHAVTTQMLSGLPADDRSARATALWSAFEVQDKPLLSLAMRRDVSFTHVHRGIPEVLDHVFVSEEFAAESAFASGRVLRVDYFNDHLNDTRDDLKSDHGLVRAVLEYRG